MKIITWFRRKENFVPIILFILACLPFIFNLRDFFVSDDWDFLSQVANPHQSLWRYFLTNYTGTHAGGSYRPLVVWFWAAAHHFFQLNYFWYHAAQIFLHAGCAALLYFLVLNFWRPAKKQDRFILAIIASVIFAILPNHSEAVIWIAAIGDPLASFFYLASLLSLLLCLRFVRAKYWLYAGSLLFFIAALFTKEIAISLPFIILIFSAYYFWQNRAREKAVKLLFTIPYFILLAGYFWLRYRAIGIFFGYYSEEHLHLGVVKTFRACLDICASFILSDKPRTLFSLWLNNNWTLVLIIFVFIIIGLIYFTWKKKLALWPWLVFLSLLVSLAPVANFGVNATATYFSEEGERFGYLPSIFFAILLAVLFFLVWKKIDNGLSLRGVPPRNDEACLPDRQAILRGAVNARLLRFARNDKKIIFVVIIIAFVVGLSVQLLLKNWRYIEAGRVARNALMSAVQEMRQGNYQGVLFFGLPDNFHGAPIFRNDWQEAISFYLPEPPIMLAPFNRTAYSPNQKFIVNKVGQGVYDYSSGNGEKVILTKPQFSSADYITALNNYSFEKQGMNDRFFGSDLQIKLSADLASNNQVALFFWNGSSWDILNTQ